MTRARFVDRETMLVYKQGYGKDWFEVYLRDCARYEEYMAKDYPKYTRTMEEEAQREKELRELF